MTNACTSEHVPSNCQGLGMSSYKCWGGARCWKMSIVASRATNWVHSSWISFLVLLISFCTCVNALDWSRSTAKALK